MPTNCSLSELCQSINWALKDAFCDAQWVTAEVSSLSVKSGHCYMELVEKDAKGGGLKAKVRANCWANVWRMLSAYFLQETGQHLQVGMQVLLQVEVDFHPSFGLALIIKDINPQFTLGDLAKQRQLTIDQLTKEGMMDLQKQLPLPSLIKRIAVVSSKDAAGFQDFVHTLSPNTDLQHLSDGENTLYSSEGYAYQLQLFQATMQGENAPRSIIRALNTLSNQQWDIVVITRGGGATTDLGCFDDYDLCNYCAQLPFPLLSAIGHTRDISILDMVGFQAVKTPTFAAEWILQQTELQAERLLSLQRRLCQTATQQISIRKERINHFESLICLRYKNAISTQRRNIDFIEKTLTLHSPETIYKKGYSLTLKNGKPLRHSTDTQPGDQLQIMLADGQITTVVQ